LGPVAATANGRLEGTERNGVIRFAGVPFAAPPVGPLRFRPPRPAADWEGVRPATSFGDISLQGPSMIEAAFGAQPEPASEDCLYLNVYTPALDGRARPVMVWIHGGAFVMGSGSSPLYDGSTFVQRGDVVVVTLNYRLAELGFSYLEHLDPDYAGSANCGILDQVAALEWVRDNIGAFGGDPDKVTIFGESAGGMSVGALLATPRARGLFHRAILQSGAAHNVVDPEHAQAATDDFMRHVGASGVAELAALPAERLLEARAAMVMAAMNDVEAVVAGERSPIGMPWQPVHDGSVIPAPAIDAIRSGSAAGIALLVGTTLDEWKLFALLDQTPLDDDLLLARANAVTGAGDRFVAAYRALHPDLGTKALFGEMANDHVFRVPAIRLAEAHGGRGDPVFMYRFSWPSRAFGGSLGACHALELPFVFHQVANPRMALFLGDGDPPVALADRMQDAWIAFARSGNPGHGDLPHWPPYDTVRRATMDFNDSCRVLDDPGSAERLLWDSLL
jgi:para-nitrobenzyl esterase